MILSFKKKFVEPILNGQKKHTIRADKPKRWKEGRKIHFATGVRTRFYSQFKEGACLATQRIDIIYPEGQTVPDIYIDGRCAWKDQIVGDLAENDGFESIGAFLKWFNKDLIDGVIIHWTNLKYLTNEKRNSNY